MHRGHEPRRQNSVAQPRRQNSIPLQPSHGHHHAPAGASMFHGSTNVDISGGNFYAVHGNTTINYYNGAPTDPYEALLDEVLALLRAYITTKFREIHQDIVSKRAPETGKAFVISKNVCDWLKTVSSVLWATGGPGAGKTYLASAVIERLEELIDENPDFVSAFAYLRYTEPLTTLDIILSIILQLVECNPLPVVLVTIKTAFLKHQRRRTRPTLGELQKLLQDILQHYSQAFVSIDGLDEMPVEVQVSLLEVLSSTTMNILITSRKLSRLEKKIAEIKTRKSVFIDVVAELEDLELFINHVINRSPELDALLEKHGIRARVVQKIMEKAGGMFLHAALQIQALRDCLNPKDLLYELARFPPGLDGLYRTTMERIERQPARHAALAKLALMWLAHVEQTLTVEDLLYALSVDPDTYEFDTQAAVTEDQLMAVCCGLISIDPETREIRLVHFSAQKLLRDLLQKYFPFPHEVLARTCMTRLIGCGFHCLSDPDSTLRGQEAMFKANPLLKYAHSWIQKHVRQALQQRSEIIPFVEHFVRSCESYPFSTRFRGDDPEECDDEDSDGSESSGETLSTDSEGWSGPNSVGTSVQFGEPRTNLGPLHVAALFDIASLIQTLLSEGLSVNAKTSGAGWTSLMVACHQGCDAAVEFLLSVPDLDLTATNQRGFTPLIVAAATGNPSIVEKLLSTPTLDVNATDSDGWSATQWASQYGFSTVLQHLLAAPSINVNQTDNRGWTALSVAAQNGHLEVVEQLLAIPGVNPHVLDKYRLTPLLMACERGHVDIAKRFLAVPNTDINHAGAKGVFPLYMACFNGHTDLVQFLLSVDGINVNQTDKYGGTPLYVAAMGGHARIVELLLAVAGIDVNKPNNDGATPLTVAAAGGKFEVITKLLAAPDIQVNQLGMEGYTALVEAAAEGHLDTVEQLLAVPGIDAHEPTDDGETALTMAARLKSPDILDRLLALPDMDINIQTDDGSTPLMLAAETGSTRVVERLLAVPGIGLNMVDEMGYTALMWATEFNRTEVVRLLLAAPGIDPNLVDKDGLSAFLMAANFGCLGPLDELLKVPGLDVNQVTVKEKESAFFLAAENGHVEVLRRLSLVPGVDINMVDKRRYSPLMAAVVEGRKEAVKVILDNPNANVNLVDKHKKSALMLAAQHGRVIITERLLTRPDVRLDLTDSKGWSALKIATKKKNSAVANLILAAERKSRRAARQLHSEEEGEREPT